MQVDDADFFWNVCSGEAPVDFSDLQQPFDSPDFNKLYRGLFLTAAGVITVCWLYIIDMIIYFF